MIDARAKNYLQRIIKRYRKTANDAFMYFFQEISQSEKSENESEYEISIYHLATVKTVKSYI